MTTVGPPAPPVRPEPRPAAAADPASAPVGVRGWFLQVRDALARPLTSYYLLLGASALLLTIGLLMVLSSSSVYSYKVNDGDSYAIVRRQLLWVAIGPALRVRGQPDPPGVGPPAGLSRLLDLAAAAAGDGPLRRRGQRQHRTGSPSVRS